MSDSAAVMRVSSPEISVSLDVTWFCRLVAVVCRLATSASTSSISPCRVVMLASELSISDSSVVIADSADVRRVPWPANDEVCPETVDCKVLISASALSMSASADVSRVSSAARSV